MAIVDITKGDGLAHPSKRGVRGVYSLTRRVDAATAVAAKGSALAVGDVVEIFQLPANTVILCAGYNVLKADTGSDVTGALGTTSGAAKFVAASSLAATGEKTATFASEQPFRVPVTLDLTIGTGDTLDSNDDWEIEVWAVVVDATSVEEVTSADASKDA